MMNSKVLRQCGWKSSQRPVKGNGGRSRPSRCLRLVRRTVTVIAILMLALIALAVGPRVYYEIHGTKDMRGKGISFNSQVNEITFSLRSDGGGGGIRQSQSEKGKGAVWVEQMSSRPRAFVMHNVLADDECDHMIQVSKDKLERSAVLGNKTKTTHIGEESEARTSSGASIPNYLDEITTAIGEKIGLWVGIPVGNHEIFSVLRYEETQQYIPHLDLLPEDRIRGSVFMGGQRTATILLYLSDVEEGGETHFPYGSLTRDYALSHSGELGTLSECGREGGNAGLRPRKGSALLFFSTDPSSILSDFLSVHQGCPVLKGTKWTTTIWMHQSTMNFLT